MSMVQVLSTNVSRGITIIGAKNIEFIASRRVILGGGVSFSAPSSPEHWKWLAAPLVAVLLLSAVLIVATL